MLIILLYIIFIRTICSNVERTPRRRDVVFHRTTNSITIEPLVRNGKETARSFRTLSFYLLQFIRVALSLSIYKIENLFLFNRNATRRELVAWLLVVETSASGKTSFEPIFPLPRVSADNLFRVKARFNICLEKSRNNNSTWIRARRNALTNTFFGPFRFACNTVRPNEILQSV